MKVDISFPTVGVCFGGIDELLFDFDRVEIQELEFFRAAVRIFIDGIQRVYTFRKVVGAVILIFATIIRGFRFGSVMGTPAGLLCPFAIGERVNKLIVGKNK